MATITLHYDAAPRLTNRPGNEFLTGLVIDHATALGWNQGFDGQDPESVAWQINEAAWEDRAHGTACSIQVSLPQGRCITPPFAGITACAEAAWRRLGLGNPSGYSFAFHPRDTFLREPEATRLFRLALASGECSAVVTLCRPEESATGPTTASAALPDLLGSLHDLLTDVSASPAGSTFLPPEFLEFHETPWQPVDAVTCRLREWSPLMAGALANAVAFHFQDPEDSTPFLLHLALAQREG